MKRPSHTSIHAINISTQYKTSKTIRETYAPQPLEQVIGSMMQTLDEDQYQLVAETLIEEDMACRSAPNKPLECSDWMVQMGYASCASDAPERYTPGPQIRYVTESGWAYIYQFVTKNLNQYL